VFDAIENCKSIRVGFIQNFTVGQKNFKQAIIGQVKISS